MLNCDSIPVGLVSIEGVSFAGKSTVLVFLSAGLYNAVELLVLIFLTFRQYRGLYFWSLLVSNVFGVIPTTVGAVLKFFAVGPPLLAIIISQIGFYAMVPVQSLVLYSRLHLVFHNERGLRFLLHLIIVVAAILLPPTTVTLFGSVYVQTFQWTEAFWIMERLQVTGFCAQEFLISFLYIWETTKLLKINPQRRRDRRKIMYQLVTINLAIVIMDTALLILEYLGLYYMQVSLKSFVYSVKLKLEFAVLGKLVTITSMHTHAPMQSDTTEAPRFVHSEHTSSSF